MFNAVATVKRVTSVAKNEIGEKTPVYAQIGTTKIRLYDKQSMYIRTATGYVKDNQKEAIIPYKTDIKQGDKIVLNSTEYLVIGINDDSLGVYLKLTLE